jgi:hypothetical protein
MDKVRELEEEVRKMKSNAPFNNVPLNEFEFAKFLNGRWNITLEKTNIGTVNIRRTMSQLSSLPTSGEH